MPKRKSQTKSYNTTLLSIGKIILETHYGHFSREWWIATKRNINDQATLLVPIRLGMQTLTKLNGYDFIITVLEPNMEISPGPRYQAICYFINNELINGDICTNSSFAITSLYKHLFGTKTKFSGPLVMGFDQEIIVEQLLKNNYAGDGYRSSFIDNVNKKQFLYVQNFTAKKCILTVYEGDKLRSIICGKTPADVWSHVDHKPKFDANKLFGIDNEYTRALISELQIPSCTPEEWNNSPLLQQIFEYHLKNKQNLSEIIELRTFLMQLYGSEYQISSRKFSVWKSMLRHMGCVEITPYNKNQCEVRNEYVNTKSVNSNKDYETLRILCDLGFLHPAPSDQAEILWNCIQESLNANKRGQDGKRRILSIVADQFSYCEIKKNLNIFSSDTINEARKYARLHGPGAERIEKPIFTQTTISREKLDQVQQFLDDKNNVNVCGKNSAASFQMVLKEHLFMTFLREKQYIYQENLGGLCSICSRYGYEIFAEMKHFIEKNIQDNNLQKDYINKLEHLRRYLKKSYEQEFEIAANGTVIHNECISHCLPYAFGICTESYSHECVGYGQLFAIFYQLKNDIPTTLHTELDEYQEHLLYYLVHQMRKVLPKSARETKEQFFGKKGWTLHSVLVYTRKEDSFKLDIQAYDHWSNDPCQDAWFTASSLHAVIESIKKKSEWVTIIFDNGSHYHNADLMMILRHWPDWYGIWPKKWIFLEPGEAKIIIDSHHAQIAYSINRHVKLGFDISSGKDIENAISGICGTSVSHLEPDRKKNLEKEETSYLVFPIELLELFDSDETTDSTCKYRNSVLDNTNYLSSYDLYSDKGKNLIRDGNKVTLNPSSQFLFWPLACRWVLKSAQKFGRKGGGKHISKKVWNLLQKYFLEGNVNKSERHTAESMLTQLKKNVEDGVIEEEKVPKLETIRNWISRYASQHCQEAAIVVQVSRT
ncbi:hypothetical protein GLOIN_2v1880126 [Rhizophagus clarus]|uniref:Uncharacterized protein n=1 Tax=Rhizophagus clarus TaxID=94130 RepID=A0A8H3KSZ6_9GLOM|nr:hypothetical protein GLOIN_2v1880126 [Rhizophagus clarus]